MSNIVPFKPDAKCDGCGATGAYDFYGDYYCESCCAQMEESDKEPMPPEPIEERRHRCHCERPAGFCICGSEQDISSCP